MTGLKDCKSSKENASFSSGIRKLTEKKWMGVF